MEEKKSVNEKSKKEHFDKKALLLSFFKKYGIFVVFLVMVVSLSVMTPSFLTTRNLLNVVRQISVIGLIAMGVTMIIITTGIDLSSGSVIALAAVIASSLAQRPGWEAAKFPELAGLPVIVPVIAGITVGLLAGFINGTIIAKTKIPAFIATLGMMTVARGAAFLYTDGRPVSNLTSEYTFIGQGEIFGIPVPIYILVTMAIIVHVLLNNTRLGRYIYAIGGNEQAALVSGINVNKVRIFVYSFAGFLTGMAAIVLSSRINTGQPGLGTGFELDAIASAVIGGTSLSGGVGTIPGTMVGALIIGVLNNGLDLLNVSSYWQQVVKGLIIVGAVIFDERKNR